MDTKLDNALSYCERLSHLKPHVLWFRDRDLTWQYEDIYFDFNKTYGY